MSNIAFGRFICSSAAAKERLRERLLDQADAGCYIHTGPHLSNVTHRVLEAIIGPCDDTVTQVFELADSRQDNTVSDLLECKVYQEIDDAWVERTPTLEERLQLVQQHFRELAADGVIVLIQLILSDQGYPLARDCLQGECSLDRLAEEFYAAYEAEGGVPTLLVTVRV